MPEAPLHYMTSSLPDDAARPRVCRGRADCLVPGAPGHGGRPRLVPDSACPRAEDDEQIVSPNLAVSIEICGTDRVTQTP